MKDIENNQAIEESKNLVLEEQEADEPLDRNVRLMSPTQMVVRRFFRSKLSVIGIIMLVALFLFCFLGPVVYNKWGEIEVDESPIVEYTSKTIQYDKNGKTHTIYQITEKIEKENALAPLSSEHPLGTDETGYDVLTRLMYGGRISLTLGFVVVILETIIGIIMGGIAGYFGGVIDNIIMRICDILMCLPGIPILLIVGVLLNGWISEGYAFITGETRIYFLMIFISCISWPGTARLVRGQILSLREQEYMVAAEAMGYSTFRKIFKHLIPNVMPQLIVQMTLSLGGMIIYESTLSYLGFGVKAPNTAWGTILNLFEEANGFEIAMANPIIWVPAGLCIVIAVLGFNFVGDGLRDALDPKSRR